MKSLKIYLSIVSVLLILALGALVYVWYMYQSLQPALTESTPRDTELITDTGKMEEESVTSESTEDRASSGVIVDTRELTETQRSILASFGYKGNIVTIPNAVVSCAEDSVGEVRFAEILDGSAPTPFELLKLSPCLKK